MQQQHGDTLQRLHAEIDHLRRENKGDVTAVGRNTIIVKKKYDYTNIQLNNLKRKKIELGLVLCDTKNWQQGL